MAVQSPSELVQKKCKPCEGGVEPYSPEEAKQQLRELQGWRLTHDGPGRSFWYRSLGAALEATAFQTREVMDAMNADSGVALESLKVDGGMVGNDLLMQFQADLLGVPVIRPTIADDLVVCLISGGASALMTAPRPSTCCPTLPSPTRN